MGSNWPPEPDLSWMSFAPEAHGIKTSVWPSRSSDSSREQQQQQQEQLLQQQQLQNEVEEQQKRKYGNARRRSSGRRSTSFDESERSGSEYDWREEEIAEEDWLQRTRERGKEQARKVSEDFGDDGDSPSVAARPTTKFWWQGVRRPYSFSPRSLRRGFQTRQKSWMQSLDEDDVTNRQRQQQLPWSRKHPRLQFALGVALLVFLVALAIGIFFLYLSFGVTARPPSSCEVDKVILNFTARRIRLKGGRYISFREQGVGADRAKYSLLVVHDLISSRLAGIPGISDSLLAEFGVRLISYDRPGYGQSDPHEGRSYYSSAQDMSDIADALGLEEKFWVAGFGIGGPHVWAAIKYIPERLAGAVLFAPAGNFYAENMTKDEIAGTWGGLNLRQRWMYNIARRFPALLPSLLQKTIVTDNPSPLQAMAANLNPKIKEVTVVLSVERNLVEESRWTNFQRLGLLYHPATRLSLIVAHQRRSLVVSDITSCSTRDGVLLEQKDVLNFWRLDVGEALKQQCAFPMAEELILLVDSWGFNLANLLFNDREVKTLLQQVVGLFQTKEKPRTFSGPIHIWQGSDDPHVPAAINEYAKRTIDRNMHSKTIDPTVNLHVLEGEGHLSWFWFCAECHRTIFNALFQPEERVPGPVGRQGFSAEEYDAILAAFGGPKEAVDKSTNRREAPISYTRKTVESTDDLLYNSADPDEEMSTGITIYVPESCQVPVDISTAIFRAIDDTIRKYIR